MRSFLAALAVSLIALAAHPREGIAQPDQTALCATLNEPSGVGFTATVADVAHLQLEQLLPRVLQLRSGFAPDLVFGARCLAIDTLPAIYDPVEACPRSGAPEALHLNCDDPRCRSIDGVRADESPILNC
jgi:hypothetical protein